MTKSEAFEKYHIETMNFYFVSHYHYTLTYVGLYDGTEIEVIVHLDSDELYKWFININDPVYISDLDYRHLYVNGNEVV